MITTMDVRLRYQTLELDRPISMSVPYVTIKSSVIRKVSPPR